jgi:hypothetical protein
MSLAELIRGKRSVALATAIPAISATHHQELAGTVARIATVAVANPCEQEPASYRWLVHFTDREPLEVCFSPEATHGEVLDFYPAAVAAEPLDEGISRLARCA